jgi:hypothetical protein
VSGKQHRIARREAYNIATTKNFWSKCRDFAPKSLRFFAKLFPFAKRKLDDKTSALYRFNITRLTREIYSSRPGTVAYRDYKAFQRAQKKAAKARAKRQLAEAARKAAAMSAELKPSVGAQE